MPLFIVSLMNGSSGSKSWIGNVTPELQSNVHTLLLVHPQVDFMLSCYYEQFLTPLKFL